MRWWQARAAGLLGETALAEDFGECWRAVEWMGLQRHLKVLGIFCRLKHRDAKPAYSADLPRFFAYATKVAVRYRELAPLVRLIEPMSGTLTTTGYRCAEAAHQLENNAFSKSLIDRDFSATTALHSRIVENKPVARFKS
ncbi:hypothetical protein PEC18_00245 [Paucibacter sp. O1-1]|nr:hypothetical protein [Paucibacter sp. O1-1]MDA3824350.1 hypothetical protein [Paucibacter sp. O1-1]